MARTSPLVLSALMLALAAAASAADSAPPEKTDPPKNTLRSSGTEGGVQCVPGVSCKIPYNYKLHVHFFNYQTYLTSKGLDGLNQKAWDDLSVEAQAQKIKTTEDLLKRRFEEILKKPVTDEERQFLEAVWDKDVAKAAQRVATAGSIKDPEQLKLELGKLEALRAKIGGAVKGVDLSKLFDGAGEKDGKEDDAVAPESGNGIPKQGSFLKSLSAPEVTTALKSEKAFMGLLAERNVPPAAKEGLRQLYKTLSSDAPSAKELRHILPTIVRFLKDGHDITMGDKDEDALAAAVPDEYNNPKSVIFYPASAKANPHTVASTAVHEFQHIYDFYAGRFYSLDSEMRGFKGDVLYMRALKESSPRDFEALASLPDDKTHGDMLGTKRLDDALKASPKAFSLEVREGRRYNRWSEGAFSGRFPVRKVAKANSSAERDWRDQKALLPSRVAAVTKAEMNLKEKQALHARTPSTENTRALKLALGDLADAERAVTSLKQTIEIQRIHLAGLREEAKWMDRHAEAGGQRPPSFDLAMAVDESYLAGTASERAAK